MSRNAWLTPDVEELEANRDERVICVPGSLWYLVGGALDLLAQAENWEEFGDATPDDMAQFFADVLDDYAMSSFRNVGMIASFATGAVPEGWQLMDGRTIAQADYPELTAKVPAIWLSGSNIILPDARNRFVTGAGPSFPNGTLGGANTHTLTTAEMPTHSHVTQVPSFGAPAAPGALPVLASTFSNQTGNVGSGNAHNNMPAYFAARWAIYAGR